MNVKYLIDQELWQQFCKSVKPLKKKPIYNEINIAKLKGYNIQAPLNIKTPSRANVVKSNILDLHGLSRQQAYLKLMHFIEEAIAHKLKTIIVITGKGKGILKQSLKHWLEHSKFSGSIVEIISASPKNGGKGAFYIKFKK